MKARHTTLAAERAVWSAALRKSTDAATEAALKKMEAQLERPALHVNVELKPGVVVLVDNWNVAHTRSAYANGRRRYVGAHFPEAHLEQRLKEVEVASAFEPPPAAEPVAEAAPVAEPKPTPPASEAASEWLAVEFTSHDQLAVKDNEGHVFACVSLTFRPEETDAKLVVPAKVAYRLALPKGCKPLTMSSLSSAEKDCAKASGVYVRVDKLASFVNDAVRDADTADPACAADEAKPPLPTSESPLAKGIQAWNDQFFNMDSASTRAHAEIYHGRGSQYVHLAKEVSHMVMWPEVQQRITKRLIENYDTLFGTGEGGGESGTTGAFLISGNVGFGRGQSTVSGSLMDLIFPPAEGGTPDAPEEPLHEGDAYARRKGGELVGDLMTSEGGKGRPPDVLVYEELVKETIRRRSDFQYLYGDDGEFVQFQHRLVALRAQLQHEEGRPVAQGHVPVRRERRRAAGCGDVYDRLHPLH